MPHWVALFAIVLVGWMVVAVAGGWLAGRTLRAVEESHAGRWLRSLRARRPRLRRAA
jgi:hypothetical protein